MTARLFHAELFGLRQGKYDWLAEHTVEDTAWSDLDPAKPFYLFRPFDVEGSAEYNEWAKITDIMPVNVTGVVTAGDKFVIDHDATPLIERIRTFIDPNLGNSEVKDRFNLNENYAWRVADARRELQAAVTGNPDAFIEEILYRPFDTRRIFWHSSVVWRMRTRAMPHMLHADNIALITSRMTKGETFKHAQVSRGIVEVICMSPKTSNNGFVFPLYLYPNIGKVDQHTFDQWPEGKDGRRPNLDPGFVNQLAGGIDLQFITDGLGDLKSTFGPEDVLHYIYAIFHCPTYRTRYAEFLKLDFPRVPITSDKDQFVTLCKLGHKVMDLHLLEDDKATGASIGYPIAGDNMVAKGYPKYVAPGAEIVKAGKNKLEPSEKYGRVYISPKQYFEGIEQEVWQFQIGGYQVPEKWLKDRRERELTHDDITHYTRIIEALRGTIDLMQQIDDAIPEWPMQ